MTAEPENAIFFFSLFHFNVCDVQSLGKFDLKVLLCFFRGEKKVAECVNAI